MPLNAIPNLQPGWMVLSTYMEDIGDNGVGGTLSGQCRFIAPIKCRVRGVAIGVQGTITSANGILVDCAAGTMGDAQTAASRIIPASTAGFNGFLCSGFDDRNTLLEAGQMFRVKSGAGAGTGKRAGVTAILEPIGVPQFAGSLFALTGSLPNATSIQAYNFPSLPGGYEVLQCWGGLAATIAGQTNSLVLLKDGGSNAGTISMSAGGNDLTVFTDATTHLNANRFIPASGRMQIASTPGAANYTSQIPFTILCRRTS